MKVVVSNAYLEWRKSNKNPRAADAVDRLLCRVYSAADSNGVPKPKQRVTNDVVKELGTVREYVVGYNYRIYANYIKVDDKDCFCLALFGNKADKDQGGDIIKAVQLFYCDSPEQWTEWTPASEQIKNFSAVENKIADVEHDDTEEQAAPVTVAEKSTKKKKGKPLDENGLTVAERKALRRKQKQEEERKQQQEEQKKRKKKQQEEQQKRQEEMEKAKTLEAEKSEPDSDAKPTVAEVVPSEPVADVVSSADASVVTDNANITDNITDDEVRIINPVSVTLNGTDVTPSELEIEDIEFKDFSDVQYHLELIDRKMAIEKLKIQKIQHEIALEELAVKKLQLLQMQKIKDMQK